MPKKYTPYFFLIPAVLLIVVFTIYPTIYTIFLSFHELNLLKSPNPVFTGLNNLVKLVQDGNFLYTLRNSLIFAFGINVSSFLISLVLALTLSEKIRFRPIFRAFAIVPWAIPWVTYAFTMKWILNPLYGLMNNYLMYFGIISRPIDLFSNPILVWPALILITSLKGYPIWFTTLLARMQAIPHEPYESAEIDGATSFQKFRYITLPMLKVVVLTLVIVTTISSFSGFVAVYTMTGGGPAGITKVPTIYLYNRAFVGFKIGYAAAIGFILFLICMILTVIYIKIFRVE